MQIWWELHEKHEEKLLNHTQFETDEDFMEGLIHVDNSPKKNKKKGTNSDKKKKSKYPAPQAVPTYDTETPKDPEGISL